MSISKQIENLRRIAKEWNPDTPINPVSITLNDAADTIESLSAKLQAVNEEREKEDHNGDILSETLEWINKRIGTKLKLEAMTNDEVYEFGHRKSIETFQEVRLYIETEIAEQKEKRSAEDCGGWISCSMENLPDKEVLCCDNHGEMILGYVFEHETSETGFSAENKHEYMHDCVKWMEKPKP